ncbi:hypothetical protein BS50DRAFT_631179 [Corynespora cassiicola Philippines]|uniref:Uncharacterized protein n=1 Tax=Corynespora cassiicola Philippines TaxID=1448308 RepID=A0A2T2P0Y4_CORCC|nr:hypothetical protein BS50DRAFT_631179 [Corynespora cassiicola Philippines]
MARRHRRHESSPARRGTTASVTGLGLSAARRLGPPVEHLVGERRARAGESLRGDSPLDRRRALGPRQADFCIDVKFATRLSSACTLGLGVLSTEVHPAICSMHRVYVISS